MVEAWRDFPSPGLIIQGDGSKYQWLNCACATWAGLIVCQMHGIRPSRGSPWYPTGDSMRRASGDFSGGVTPRLLDDTTNRVYGIDLDVRIATVDTVQDRLDRRFAVGLLVQYWPISNAGWSGSPGFMGAHSVGIYGTRKRTDTGVIEWLVGDPLYDGRRSGIPRGMKWIPRSVMIKAGRYLVLDSSGQTMIQRYGLNYLYAVFTTRSFDPSVPPVQTPRVVLTAPTTLEERNNKMIRGAYGVSSTKVQRLAQGQPLFAYPGGPKVTAMSRASSVSFLGKTSSSWGMVLAMTGSPYSDKKTRPTGLYVPVAAGPISDR